MEESIPTKGYVISQESGKPVEVSGMADNIGMITQDGVELVKGGNIDFKINTVRLIPTSNQAIDLKKLPDSMFKKSLMTRAKNGILPNNILLTPQETKALNNLGFGDAISDKPYAEGEIKNLEKYQDPKTGKNRFRKSLTNSYLVPYENFRGQLKNVGFEIIKPEERQKGYKAYKLRSKGYDYTWNDKLGKYE